MVNQRRVMEAKKERELKKRSWRDRKERLGEMAQMDGSHHDWLEGRGAKMVLMGYTDDATGRVYAKFYEYEGTHPAMDSLKGYIKTVAEANRFLNQYLPKFNKQFMVAAKRSGDLHQGAQGHF